MRAFSGIIHGSRAFGGPLSAIIELTNRCNLRCIHCYYYSPLLDLPLFAPLRRAKQMGLKLPDRESLKKLHTIDADTVATKSVIKELLDMGTTRFQFSASGEPFMHGNVMDFMGMAKRGGAYCLVNTNGTLLDCQKIDELILMGFDELRITIMGGSEDVYRRTHPGAGKEIFYRLKDSLNYIAQQKELQKIPNPKVTLICIVVPQNCDSLFDFAEFAAQVRANRVMYRPVDDVDDDGLAQLILTEEQAVHVREQLVKVESLLDDRGITHNIKNFLRVFRQKLDTSDLYRIIPCYYVWLSTKIEADGKVYPCCRCYQPIGNIHESRFASLWNSEQYSLVRKAALNLNKRRSPVRNCHCFNCVHHEVNAIVYKKLHPLKRRSLSGLN
jgi:radical SAM protein with 4Fe4S-binding SPASM domain